MKKQLGLLGLFAFLMVMACSKSDNGVGPVTAGDYPLVTYALERSPKINRLGAGMDFIHESSSPDTSYFGASTDEAFVADAVFYNLMAYYTDENGDVQSEGCPAILLDSDVKALEVGAGTTYFDEFTVITEDMIDDLTSEEVIDFEACRNADGLYDRDLVMAAYESCIIGNKFRGRVLVAPEGTSEQAVQPVFLIQTVEKGYVKFMVKQFKGDGADKQKTIVQWQVMYVK